MNSMSHRLFRFALRLSLVALLGFCGGTAGAANIIVTTTADGIDAAASAPTVTLASLPGPDGQVTLREAISAANTNAGADIISFSVNGTFTLSGAVNDDNGSGGDLDVKQSVTIQGNGTANTIIDGGGIERIFDVFPSAATTFELSNLTLQNGDTRTTSFKEGGAMYLHNNVTTMIVDCRVISNFSGANGAIENRGTLIITGSVLSGNQTIPASGNVVGGAMHNAGTLTMANCTIDNNSVRGEGGGIATSTGFVAIVTITGCTFSNNAAVVTGGGLGNGGAISTTSNQGTINITNCTFANNRADNHGGAAFFSTPGGGTGNATLSNVTITANTADHDNSGSGTGGGIAQNTASVTLRNTIVSGNFNSINTVRDDCSGAVNAASSFNFIGVDTGLTGITHGANSNQIGTAGTPIDALLGVLANNGGPTQTCQPAGSSPVLDKGKVFASATIDQRGAGFARTVDLAGIANASGGDGTDIGAYEEGVPPDTTPPTVAPVKIESNNSESIAFARAGDSITVTFAASEPIQVPTVTIQGQVTLITNPTGNLWEASAVVTHATPDGPANFTIDYSDLAGNAGTQVTATTDGSRVTIAAYDRPANPALSSNAVAGPVVRGTPLGDPVTGSGPSGATLAAGATLSSLFTPALDDLRSLVARATVLNGRSKLAAIYTEDAAGAGSVLAFQGGPVLDDTGVALTDATFKSFSEPVIGNFGGIAFGAKLQGKAVKAADHEGVWSDLFSPGSLRLILRKNDLLPGFLNGEKLKSVTSLAVSTDGLLALVKLAPLRGFVTVGKDDVALLLITAPSTGQILLRTGADFQGVKIKTLATLAPALGSAGQGRWDATDQIAAKLTLTDRRVFIVSVDASGAPPTELVRAGEVEPGLGFELSKLGLPALGPRGRFGFVGKLATVAPGNKPDTANLLYAAFPPALSTLIQGGITPADPGTLFSTFFDPVVNDDQMLFQATIRGDGVRKTTKTGLWQTDGVSLNKIARLGDPAPGADGTPLTDTFWAGFTSYALPGGLDAGPIFVAKLSGKGVTAKSKVGLWAKSSTTPLRLILRTGQDVTVGGGTKTLASMTLLNALPGSFGVRRSYNTTGSIAVLATFTDKTQALLRADIP